jgi:hypothetical protein
MDAQIKELAIIKAALGAGMRKELLADDVGLVEKISSKVQPHLNELAVIEDDGEPVSLPDYFDALRRTNKALFDINTEPAADMTLKEKTEFVRLHGMDAFVKMRTQQKAGNNPNEWTTKQKTDFIKTHGAEKYAELRRKHPVGSKLRPDGTRLGR